MTAHRLSDHIVDTILRTVIRVESPTWWEQGYNAGLRDSALIVQQQLTALAPVTPTTATETT